MKLYYSEWLSIVVYLRSKLAYTTSACITQQNMFHAQNKQGKKGIREMKSALTLPIEELK